MINPRKTIAALLRRAQGKGPEAESARAIASEMMGQYGISKEEAEAEEVGCEIADYAAQEPTEREGWRSQIAMEVCRVLQVKGYWRGGKLHFVGLRAKLAAELYPEMIRQSNEEAAKQCPLTIFRIQEGRKVWFNHFRQGVVKAYVRETPVFVSGEGQNPVVKKKQETILSALVEDAKQVSSQFGTEAAAALVMRAEEAGFHFGTHFVIEEKKKKMLLECESCHELEDELGVIQDALKVVQEECLLAQSAQLALQKEKLILLQKLEEANKEVAVLRDRLDRVGRSPSANGPVLEID